jgi:hypothetical protein
VVVPLVPVPDVPLAPVPDVPLVPVPLVPVPVVPVPVPDVPLLPVPAPKPGWPESLLLPYAPDGMSHAKGQNPMLAGVP